MRQLQNLTMINKQPPIVVKPEHKNYVVGDFTLLPSNEYTRPVSKETSNPTSNYPTGSGIQTSAVRN